MALLVWTQRDNALQTSRALLMRSSCSFVGRALITIQFRDEFNHRAFCSDTRFGLEDKQERDEINGDRKFISHLFRRHPYLLFTTFYAANYIPPNLKSVLSFITALYLEQIISLSDIS